MHTNGHELAAQADKYVNVLHPDIRVASFVMSSGNVTLHPVKSGGAAKVRACLERAERVEWETSLDISAELIQRISAMRFHVTRDRKH